MEDGVLAKLGFLVEMGILVEIGFLVELGNLEEWSFLLKQGFLLEVGNVNPKWHQVAATRKISKSKKEKVSKVKIGEEFQVKEGEGHVFLMLEGLLSIVGHKLEGSRVFLPFAASSKQFPISFGAF